MFSILAAISILSWVGAVYIKGFGLYTFSLLLPTILFLVRKFGYFISFKNIVISEGMFLFLSLTWNFIFATVSIKSYLLLVIVRAVFLLTVLYDDKVYVYVTEERKK